MVFLFLFSLFPTINEPIIRDTGIFDGLVARHVAVSAENGVVFVADAYEHKIHVYSLTGTRIKTIGGEGDGPDKFKFIFRIIFFDGVLYAIDQIGRAVVAFDSSGEFLARYRPHRLFFGSELHKPTVKGWLCADQENLILLDREFGNPTAIIGQVADSQRRSLEELQASMTLFQPGKARLRFDVTADGKHLFVFRPGRDMRVEIWDAVKMRLTSVIETELALPEPTRAWADGQLEKYLALRGPDSFGNPRKKKVVVPDYFPGVFHLWLTPDDKLQIMTGAYFLDKTVEPLVVDLEGNASETQIAVKYRHRVLGKIDGRYLVPIVMPPDDEVGIALVGEDELGLYFENTDND